MLRKGDMALSQSFKVEQIVRCGQRKGRDRCPRPAGGGPNLPCRPCAPAGPVRRGAASHPAAGEAGQHWTLAACKRRRRRRRASRHPPLHCRRPFAGEVPSEGARPGCVLERTKSAVCLRGLCTPLGSIPQPCTTWHGPACPTRLSVAGCPAAAPAATITCPAGDPGERERQGRDRDRVRARGHEPAGAGCWRRARRLCRCNSCTVLLLPLVCCCC